MKTSERVTSESLDYKHHNIIKTFTNVPVHFLLKLYQISVWAVMVWILKKFYTVFGDTVSLFLFINACLDFLLILVQSQRPVLKPCRSRDLPSVLCVLVALLIQLVLNIGLLCYIAGGKDYQVYNAAWKEDQWNYLSKDEHHMEEAGRVTVIALLCELPHILAWLLYVWARFYPSRSGDVVIDPGYVQAKKEEQEKEEKDTIRNLEEEKRKNALEAEARRIKEMEEDKAFRQMELGRNRNFLIAVKCD